MLSETLLPTPPYTFAIPYPFIFFMRYINHSPGTDSGTGTMISTWLYIYFRYGVVWCWLRWKLLLGILVAVAFYSLMLLEKYKRSFIFKMNYMQACKQYTRCSIRIWLKDEEVLEVRKWGLEPNWRQKKEADDFSQQLGLNKRFGLLPF